MTGLVVPLGAQPPLPSGSLELLLLLEQTRVARPPSMKPWVAVFAVRPVSVSTQLVSGSRLEAVEMIASGWVVGPLLQIHGGGVRGKIARLNGAWRPERDVLRNPRPRAGRYEAA